ncbi:MAG: asparagine synthase (glutamine-hydrolyzing) [Acidobacteriota bacterium]|nr:asparagine synthase (glutamine-hydrolyzing) [Acidobacteriota bacterium]
MCGIAGFAGPSASEEPVRRMMASLARRGPDGEGLESWPGAVLGHRRLSIYDLSEAGHQPMLSPDGSIGIIFNGSIYNFLQIRAVLEKCGYRFRSNSDTEVLIHGYREWGIDALVARLRGMFAIALWDHAQRKLFLIRDRLGVKPLVYTVRDGSIAFASTPRALRHGGFVDRTDTLAVAQYLEFGYIPDPGTIYEDAVKLAPATILEWRAGEIRQRQYWTPVTVSENDAPSFEEAVEETERLFLEAVEMRLEADVPVGALLSGGVDSSLVCWAIAKLGGEITAFTVGTPGDPWDETADARATAKMLGIRHQVIEADADIPGVDELAAAFGEPFACASALGILRVSKAIKPSATVLLTGDGGDDVFLGYPEHKSFYTAQRLARALPGPLAKGWPHLRGVVPQVGPLRRALHLADYAAGGVGAVAQAHDGLPVYRRHGLLGASLADISIPQRDIPWSPQAGREVLSGFLEYDRKTRFTGEYMTKVDGGTMYYALEARSPFLDQELWNFAAALPFNLRLRGGTLKAVLRELARRRIGPRVAAGPKRGFGIPVQRWLTGRWRCAFETALDDSILAEQAVIRPDAVRRLLSASAKKEWAPVQLWYLFVLEAWLRRERDEYGRVSPSAETLRQSNPVF